MKVYIVCVYSNTPTFFLCAILTSNDIDQTFEVIKALYKFILLYGFINGK